MYLSTSQIIYILLTIYHIYIYTYLSNYTSIHLSIYLSIYLSVLTKVGILAGLPGVHEAHVGELPGVGHVPRHRLTHIHQPSYQDNIV